MALAGGWDVCACMIDPRGAVSVLCCLGLVLLLCWLAVQSHREPGDYQVWGLGGWDMYNTHQGVRYIVVRRSHGLGRGWIKSRHLFSVDVRKQCYIPSNICTMLPAAHA
ncbi:hypothetical protein N658DRAFT_93564 [Parathielavia hyrcaniae]|uniref:Uncharacterized protein n=1 Tax=Parathielavia hyrcaniae TaxID=113614 RepID=A0AAN6T1K5_9PEZI|nr:hypothetical protein N658DRAFT_93564 [Parathielavia hyrcaniae]